MARRTDGKGKYVRRADKLNTTLENKIRKSKKEDDGSVVVGYFGVSYAIRVHEDLSTPHKIGMAKFLELPWRQNSKDYTKLIQRLTAKGVGMIQAMLMAGMRLQRDSMELVPIDTGNLIGSAQTKVEK